MRSKADLIFVALKVADLAGLKAAGWQVFARPGVRLIGHIRKPEQLATLASAMDAPIRFDSRKLDPLPQGRYAGPVIKKHVPTPYSRRLIAELLWLDRKELGFTESAWGFSIAVPPAQTRALQHTNARTYIVAAQPMTIRFYDNAQLCRIEAKAGEVYAIGARTWHCLESQSKTEDGPPPGIHLRLSFPQALASRPEVS